MAQVILASGSLGSANQEATPILESALNRFSKELEKYDILSGDMCTALNRLSSVNDVSDGSPKSIPGPNDESVAGRLNGLLDRFNELNYLHKQNLSKLKTLV